MPAMAVASPNPDTAFPELKSLIIARTGHFYYEDKDGLLWERVRKRLKGTGLGTCAEYLDLLNNPISGEAEWSRLEADITIGETFFFRYTEQFAALRETILPEMVSRKRGEKRLRIWSAGCATGAEPYSLAILLSQLLGDELAEWRLGIVGTDINETFLASARKAQYGPWALRSLSPEEKERHFIPSGRNLWQLRPEFRSLVRFDRHNILSLLEGTSPLQYSEFDLILCRNVLIYFHPDTAVRVVRSLRDCLRDEGWMLLGHAEPNPAFADFLGVVSLPGTVAYRRSLTAGPSGRTAAMTPVPVAAVPASRKPKPPVERPHHVPRAAQPPQKPSSPFEPSDLLAVIRKEADAGNLAAAGALCRQALLDHPLNPVLHFYQGVISWAMVRADEAEKAFRRGIYLDKNFVMAHYHLGLVLLADGRHGPGRRSLTNAVRAAAGLRDDQEIAEADGLTAGELRNLVRAHLAALSRTGRKERA